MKEKQLSAGFLIRSNDKFLICRACAGPKANPEEGKWTIPKGHVEDGETSIDAAYRETKEECGIDLKKLPYVDVWKHFSHMYSLRNKDVIVFFTDDKSGMLQDEILSCESFVDGDKDYPEIDAYKWVSYKEAKIMITRSQQELFSKKMPWIRDLKKDK
jgi:8-oxo-dGTP pyrophosphatase MutT (NUDIX family)